ncbi:GGDEF domain-containing protein [Litchfieldia salsa]|uniref:Diguanylate cyclase (GGDEF) domain-containing protein n=1 Tax=Litchfieldia salsa TaxID=930152 RepID=A0A1H0Q633_9BACI|nr:GGDEF domain-containing protein [Litchfieldia salsa]SDP12774.1 diguanylate cyclase (GGDEF) domain-containing protein [Litchfieldia salsa]
MENHNGSRMNYKLWSEKILYFYWVMVIVSIIGQIIGLIVTVYYNPEYVGGFLVKQLVLPTGIQLIIILVCLYIIKVKQVYSSKVLTMAGTLVALVIILIHPNVQGLQVILLLPMAVSLIYFDKRKLRFSLTINLFALTIIYLFPSIRMAATEYDYISYLFALLAGYFIYSAVLQRGNEVLQTLRQSSEKEKELIVKSTMMERMSKIDALTDLYNHKTFQEYLDHLVGQSKNYNMPLQLAIIDIDNFKNINDTYGHNIGDLVLKRVADAIRERVTEEDIVARYGGEEFTIILTNKNIETAYHTVEAIRIHVENLQHAEMENGKVTISIGLKNYHHNLTKVEFFQQTDALLYQAKRSGKNKVIYE